MFVARRKLDSSRKHGQLIIRYLRCGCDDKIRFECSAVHPFLCLSPCCHYYQSPCHPAPALWVRSAWGYLQRKAPDNIISSHMLLSKHRHNTWHSDITPTHCIVLSSYSDSNWKWRERGVRGSERIEIHYSGLLNPQSKDFIQILKIIFETRIVEKFIL